ncbi:MAG: hypothetical protein HY290_01225 [Planctomycetia bacterium]|nr:hypothetical protein [Planctomycetia bacterium]
MSHVVRRLDWGVIDLDTVAGRIFFQQTWFYDWQVVSPVSPWTLAEKQAFHHALDRQVWGHWSMRFQFVPHGATDFARRFVHGIPINLDIKWVTRPGSFTVNVVKRPGPVDHSIRPWVNFTTKVIQLSKWDTSSYTAVNAASASSPKPFQPLPHEFGHALGTANDDEYAAGHANLGDTNSIMNIGSQVRARHLESIRGELNAMMPGVTFTVAGPHHGHGHGHGHSHGIGHGAAHAHH